MLAAGLTLPSHPPPLQRSHAHTNHTPHTTSHYHPPTVLRTAASRTTNAAPGSIFAHPHLRSLVLYPLDSDLNYDIGRVFLFLLPYVQVQCRQGGSRRLGYTIRILYGCFRLQGYRWTCSAGQAFWVTDHPIPSKHLPTLSRGHHQQPTRQIQLQLQSPSIHQSAERALSLSGHCHCLDRLIFNISHPLTSLSRPNLSLNFFARHSRQDECDLITHTWPVLISQGSPRGIPLTDIATAPPPLSVAWPFL